MFRGLPHQVKEKHFLSKSSTADSTAASVLTEIKLLVKFSKSVNMVQEPIWRSYSPLHTYKEKNYCLFFLFSNLLRGALEKQTWIQNSCWFPMVPHKGEEEQQQAASLTCSSSDHLGESV